MDTQTTCTIHVITTLSGEPWRSHLKSKLEALHPEADVRVGSGSLRDVMVWTKEMTSLGTSPPDMVSVSDTDADDDDLFDDEEDFLSEVAAAEDYAERVENECDGIERAWKTSSASSRVKRVRVRAAGVAGFLTAALGLFP